jgi:hypothetical protein
VDVVVLSQSADGDHGGVRMVVEASQETPERGEFRRAPAYESPRFLPRGAGVVAQ